jgi:hypothetical protein
MMGGRRQMDGSRAGANAITPRWLCFAPMRVLSAPLGTCRPRGRHAPLPRRAGRGPEILGTGPGTPITRLATGANGAGRVGVDRHRSRREDFRAAIGLDQLLGEAWFGLALLELQSGDADATLAACREGTSCTLTQPQRAVRDKFKTVVRRFASSGQGANTASPRRGGESD